MSSDAKKTAVLVILDGWGYREGIDHNAIHHARTPVWDGFLQHRPNTLIETSGLSVGLPEGQMGNSEVGHMTLGAGRVVYQQLTRMDKAIADGSFNSNSVYCDAIDGAVKSGKRLHIMGLLSPGGVHSHESHIRAIIKLAIDRGAREVFVHAFLDGRDTPPRSAANSIAVVDQQLRSAGVGRVASICGRYYAMDRDKRWDRVEQAYKLMAQAEADYRADDGLAALELAYNRDENDEFVSPTVIAGEGEVPAVIEDGDSVIFMNFRADRAREITHALVDEAFEGFERKVVPELACFVMSTEYEDSLAYLPCAFPAEDLKNSLGEYLSSQGKTQLRIAETEKYAHVTFFFSGGREKEYKGEDRVLIPSPQVATYDLKPEMSAPEMTDELTRCISSGKYDLIVCNFANGDMVGHTGVYEAAIAAAEAVDLCLEKIAKAVDQAGADCLITADHGNAEMMLDEDGQPHTQHTVGKVHLIYLGPKSLSLGEGGTLADVSPTLLELMALSQPLEMTGQSLIR